MAEVRFFGIRHHGPGCARSLVRAFAAWQPDAVLVEGPPEADGLLPHLNDAALVPPVALLVHAVGYLACLREPRVFDLWITKVSRCPRVGNWQRWGCNSYAP